MAECPAPDMCIQGPDPHIWTSGYCERIDEGWSTDVASSSAHLTPSADLPACRDEDPAHAATLAAAYPGPHLRRGEFCGCPGDTHLSTCPAAAYPDPPEYQHPEEPLEYTEADRAYDRQAFARDYGLREDWL